MTFPTGAYTIDANMKFSHSKPKSDVIMVRNEALNEPKVYEDVSPCISVLPKDYVLGRNDVMCGRGKRSYLHSGNKRLRKIIQQNLDRYYGAPNKSAKSTIIHEIVKEVRNGQPPGNFVKYEPLAGRYYEVKPLKAQEKVSHAFRDALNGTVKGRKLKSNKRHLSIEKSMDHYFESSFSGDRFRSHNDPISHVTQVRPIDDQTVYSSIGIQENCYYTQDDQRVSNNTNDHSCIHQLCRSTDTVTLTDSIMRSRLDCLQHHFESQSMAVVEDDFLSSMEVFNKMDMSYRWDDDPFEPCPIRE